MSNQGRGFQQPLVTRTSKRYPQGRIPGTSTNLEGILGNPQGPAAPKEMHSPSHQILHPSGEEFQEVSGPEPKKEDHPRRRPQETKQGATQKGNTKLNSRTKISKAYIDIYCFIFFIVHCLHPSHCLIVDYISASTRISRQTPTLVAPRVRRVVF